MHVVVCVLMYTTPPSIVDVSRMGEGGVRGLGKVGDNDWCIRDAQWGRRIAEAGSIVYSRMRLAGNGRVPRWPLHDMLLESEIACIDQVPCQSAELSSQTRASQWQKRGLSGARGRAVALSHSGDRCTLDKRSCRKPPSFPPNRGPIAACNALRHTSLV